MVLILSLASLDRQYRPKLSPYGNEFARRHHLHTTSGVELLSPHSSAAAAKTRFYLFRNK
jgi:hypothetical protein